MTRRSPGARAYGSPLGKDGLQAPDQRLGLRAQLLGRLRERPGCVLHTRFSRSRNPRAPGTERERRSGREVGGQPCSRDYNSAAGAAGAPPRPAQQESGRRRRSNGRQDQIPGQTRLELGRDRTFHLPSPPFPVVTSARKPVHKQSPRKPAEVTSGLGPEWTEQTTRRGRWTGPARGPPSPSGGSDCRARSLSPGVIARQVRAGVRAPG